MKRILRSKASDEWRTPTALFEALDREFAFWLDLAATSDNKLVDAYLGPGSAHGEDALAVSWMDVYMSAGFSMHEPAGFLNPPYSAALIGPFMRKAAEEAVAGFTTVALVKYDPSTRWWEWTRSASEIREIKGRVPFTQADGTTKAGAMFPSAVVVFRPQPGIVRAQPRRVVWDYRKVDER